MAAESLAPDKGLALEPRESIADGGECENDGSGDQATVRDENAQKLDESHGRIYCSTQVVGGDPANRSIKGRRGRADS